jgi:hypothetical protein
MFNLFEVWPKMPTNGLKATKVLTSQLPRITPALNPQENRSQISTWIATPMYDKWFVQVCSCLATMNTRYLTG